MIMKRVFGFVFVLILVISVAAICVAEPTEKMSVKIGDDVYVCGCGEGCDCNYISTKPGKCTCGKDLVKAKVTGYNLATKKVMVSAKGWDKERYFNAEMYCSSPADCKITLKNQHSVK